MEYGRGLSSDIGHDYRAEFDTHVLTALILYNNNRVLLVPQNEQYLNPIKSVVGPMWSLEVAKYGYYFYWAITYFVDWRGLAVALQRQYYLLCTTATLRRGGYNAHTPRCNLKVITRQPKTTLRVTLYGEGRYQVDRAK